MFFILSYKKRKKKKEKRKMLKPKVTAKSAKTSPSGFNLKLPTSKTRAGQSLTDYAMFIYGEQKIGKTSLTTKFPDALHCFFEPSGTDYELHAIQPKGWAEFLAYLDLLEKEDHDFDFFIIDVVDIAYDMCMLWTCQDMNGPSCTYPPTTDFGKTWKAVKDNFRRTMDRLRRLGGIIFVSHQKVSTIKEKSGFEYQKVVPSAPAGCAEVLSKWCDLTGYYSFDGTDRKLFITPEQGYEAGNRMSTRFNYTDGTKMSSINMGNSEGEAFKNFVKAFGNKLEKPKTEKPKVGGLKK